MNFKKMVFLILAFAETFTPEASLGLVSASKKGQIVNPIDLQQRPPPILPVR